MAQKYKTLPDGSRFSNTKWEEARKRALATYEHKCAICGQDLDKNAPPFTKFSIEIDHIIPKSRGGSPYALENLRIACSPCNRKKNNRLDAEMNKSPKEYGAPISNRW